MTRLYLLLGVVTLALSLAFYGGCQVQQAREAKARKHLETQLAAADVQLALTKQMFQQMTQDTDRAKQTADKHVLLAAKLVQQTQKDFEAYKATLTQTDRAIEKARKDPDCAAQLDTPLCTPLH